MNVNLEELKVDRAMLQHERDAQQAVIEEAVKKRDKAIDRLRLVDDLIRLGTLYEMGQTEEPIPL